MLLIIQHLCPDTGYLALNKKIPFEEEELKRDLSQPLAGKDPSTVTIPTLGIIICLLLYLFVIALFVVLFVAVLCVILHPPVVAAATTGGCNITQPEFPD